MVDRYEPETVPPYDPFNGGSPQYGDVRQQGKRIHVVERHRLTGRYRRRTVAEL